MSDENFGEAGLEQAAGYRPMVDPTPEPPAVPDYDDAMAAAEELTRKREAERNSHCKARIHQTRRRGRWLSGPGKRNA